jgi:hypothetical protein
VGWTQLYLGSESHLILPLYSFLEKVLEVSVLGVSPPLLSCSFVLCWLAEIVDGNMKMTLGMIWTIILRFAIQDISVEG